MVGAINNKEKVIASTEAGLHSLKTALSIYKCIGTKKPVRL
jgi:hypothetical protein